MVEENKAQALKVNFLETVASFGLSTQKEAAITGTLSDSMRVFTTVNECWEYWFALLLSIRQTNQGAVDPSRDGAVAAEVLNATSVITDPTRFIVTSKTRNMPMRYAVGELIWYMAGSNKLKDIQLFSSAWDRMSDDGMFVNSGYGHKIKHFYGFDQWEDVKKRLRKDPLSRQAVIHIKNAFPVSEPTKDTPCTLTLQFFIRDEKLHLTVNMRSNDIWTGVPYDMFSFCAMQIKMAMELGVGVGTYTHHAGSLHLYERNVPNLLG